MVKNKIDYLKEHWDSIISNFKEIDGQGICGIHKFMFTYGIVTDIQSYSYKGRWCYETLKEAQIALKNWDGKGDPPGLWRKYKGEGGEYGNKFRDDFDPEFDILSPHVLK